MLDAFFQRNSCNVPFSPPPVLFTLFHFMALAMHWNGQGTPSGFVFLPLIRHTMLLAGDSNPPITLPKSCATPEYHPRHISAPGTMVENHSPSESMNILRNTRWLQITADPGTRKQDGNTAAVQYHLIVFTGFIYDCLCLGKQNSAEK